MSIWIIFIIGVSLSMDAFSLSLAYGTLDLKEKDMDILSIIVGIYHFIMPLLGVFIGAIILKWFPINPDIIVFIVLSFIGIQMLIESKKEQDDIKKLTILEMLCFGLAVSIDSFSVGVGLRLLTSHHFLCAGLFALTSFGFTFLGLHLGKKVHQRLGKISTIIGGLVLVILGLVYLI
ncbi:MAG: hypothetical protein HFH09_01545 [Bacilli bacterium]|jgi:putative Mn2+ efflux pump MntP|nr:hypothetical protein [Bacilli bacterium]